MYEGSCQRLGCLKGDAEIDLIWKSFLLDRKWIFILNVNQRSILPCFIHQVLYKIIILLSFRLLSIELQVHDVPNLAG